MRDPYSSLRTGGSGMGRGAAVEVGGRCAAAVKTVEQQLELDQAHIKRWWLVAQAKM
jgi:hypothetical protein